MKNKFGLTYKQEQFVHKLIEHKGNQTKAALEAYDTDNPRIATNIGTENCAKPNIQAYLIHLANKHGCTPDRYFNKLSDLVEAKKTLVTPTGQVIQANDNSLQLRAIQELREVLPQFQIARADVQVGAAAAVKAAPGNNDQVLAWIRGDGPEIAIDTGQIGEDRESGDNPNK
jgi:phage terminase small subunit